MTDNQIIHEAMGLCWHEPTPKLGNCKKCGFKFKLCAHKSTINPNYLEPEHYCKIMDWLRDGNNAMNFCKWCDCNGHGYSMDDFIYLGISEQVNLVAEWIRSK